MGKKILFIALLISAFNTYSQDSVFVDLSTPYGAIRTHLYYLQDEHYNVEAAAAPFKRDGITEEQAQENAIKLKQIWDGVGEYIDMEMLPRTNDYLDSVRKKHHYLINRNEPEIFLERTKSGQWQYSATTLASINNIHDEVFPFGTDKLLEFLPKMGTRQIFGLYLYQYLGILILALLSVIIHRVFTFLIEQVFLKFLLRAGFEDLADRFLLPVARPVSVFIVILLLKIFFPVLQLKPEIAHWVMLSTSALLPLFGMIVFYRLVDVVALYLDHVAKKTQSTLDDQLVPLVRKTLKTFVVAIGTLFVLQNLDIPIIPLLTGLSIGGLAFALAAQDTIKNFFGSLMIFIDRPFQIGDWITSGDIDGTVEEVGFRSSRIRTFRNSLMYVPNGRMADSTIDNHGMRQYRRFYTQIAVTYDTPPELIDTFVQGLRKIVESHSDTRKDYYNIFLNDMASSSLNIMFYIFFEVPDWTAELKARHEVLLEIIKLAKALGVHFAFPTQTLHMENFPGQTSLSPSYMKNEELDSKLGAYFDKKPS